MKKEYTGFIAPKITPDHYVMGSGNVPFQVIKPDGDWTPDLPESEVQSRDGLESYNCTGYGTAKMISEYIFQAFGIKENYSKRWIGIIAKTAPPGNDPHTVLEAIRKYGLIPDEMLPFSNDITSVEDYFSFKGADEIACRQKGREWLSKYSLSHEWVFDPTSNLGAEEVLHNMKVALKYSPLGVGVYAWATDERGIYVKLGDENHWTNIYKIDDFLNIFDSYDPFLKKADQIITFCKRIHIEKVELPSNSVTDIVSVIFAWIKKLLAKILSW